MTEPSTLPNPDEVEENLMTAWDAHLRARRVQAAALKNLQEADSRLAETRVALDDALATFAHHNRTDRHGEGRRGERRSHHPE